MKNNKSETDKEIERLKGVKKERLKKEKLEKLRREEEPTFFEKMSDLIDNVLK